MQVRSNQIQNNLIDWKYKIGLIICVILLIIAIVFIIKQQRDIKRSQEIIEKSVVETKKLQDGSIRSQAKYATREDIEKIIKNNGIDLSVVEEDVKKLGAEIKGVSTILSKTPGFNGRDLPSTVVTPNPQPPQIPDVTCPDGSKVNCPNSDKYGYLASKQTLKLDEPYTDGLSIPFGEVSFSAWRERPWDLIVNERNYFVVSVLSTDEDGRHFVHNKFIIESGGKKHTVPITQSQFTEVYPEYKFRFSPHLYLGISGGLILTPPTRAEIAPSLELALFSYGKTKRQPTWTFFNVGLMYGTQEQAFGGILAPINYNFGEQLPLIDNLYMGPAVTLDFGGNLGVMLGVRVGL